MQYTTSSLHLTQPPNTELLEAKPPSKALALCCRQIYEEAKLLYRAAYRKFWTGTRFLLRMDVPSPCHGKDEDDWRKYFDSICMQVHSLNSEDVENIEHLRIFEVGFGSPEWVLDQKVWLARYTSAVEEIGLCVPSGYRAALNKAGYKLYLNGMRCIVGLDLQSTQSVDVDEVKEIVKGRKLPAQEIIAVMKEVEDYWDAF